MKNSVVSSDKLHLGCGLTTPSDWLNVDGSLNARLAQRPNLMRLLRTLRLVPQAQSEVKWSRDITIHDVRKPLPFADNQFRAVYASHLLEHLYLTQAKELLAECRRVLRPNGIIRIVVPDLHAIVQEYNNELEIELPSREMLNVPMNADLVNHRLLLRKKEPVDGNVLFRLYSLLNDFHSHKWMYDADSLAHHIREAGFVDVEEKAFRESQLENIEAVEMPSRVLGGMGICVEGVNPA